MARVAIRGNSAAGASSSVNWIDAEMPTRLTESGPVAMPWLRQMTVSNSSEKIIAHRIIKLASQYLPRLMRPSNPNRNDLVSIARPPDGRKCPAVRNVGRVRQVSVRLIPQQLVDAGFGAGALVDPLDDDRAGGRGPGLAVFQGARRQHARHHHGIL